MGLTWAGIEEERAVYLGDYTNVVRDLADSSPEDWDLVRAAMLHIAHSEGLCHEHNRWLGQEILDTFEQEAQHHLYCLTLDTLRDRPTPKPDPQEMFPNHDLTHREATYYHSRAALAVLVSKDDPHQAIELFEVLNTIFAPRICYCLPGGGYSLYLDRVLDRLPDLYERVGRFEDALNFTPISFDHLGRDVSSCNVAIRRLEGWLGQLSGSGGVSAVERFLDLTYEWLDKASEVDEEERDHIGDCPRVTRQFWAWYYGNALGRLMVARLSLRASLLDEIEAGEWENCWHVAGVLFEAPPESWDEYRQRALKFYNSSEIEHNQQGSIPWNSTQPPHLSAQSDLFWAMRVGFADAHSETAVDRRESSAGIAESLEQINTITSSMAQHVLRTERNTDNLLEDVKNRVPPNHEYWYGLLQKELPGLVNRLSRATVDHLIDASRHRSAKEWDYCKVSLCKSVESLFLQILVPRIQALPESSELTLALPRGKRSPRKHTQKDWGNISLSNWSQILSTSTEGGMNGALRLALPRAFSNIDLHSLVNLNVELATIAQLRGSSAHDSRTAEDQKLIEAEELWGIVVGSNGDGFLDKFYAALGLTVSNQGPGNADNS